HAVAGESLERALVLEDEPAHLRVVLAQHPHDLLGLRGLREGREPAEVEEDHGDLATVALEGILGIPADDHFGELGGEEALEARESLELRYLRLHALLEGPVSLGELVVEQLDPQDRLRRRE